MADNADDPATDCYEFAVSGLGAHRARRLDSLYAVPGQAGGVVFDGAISPDDVSRRAASDGLIPVGDDLEAGMQKYPQFKEGFYPVALYFGKNKDGSINPGSTHWMMRNEQGQWVDKHGDLPVYDPEFADDPALMQRYAALGLDQSNLGPKDAPPEKYGRYQLHSFFLVPHEGLDVGLDAFFDRAPDEVFANKETLRTLVLSREFEIRAGGTQNLLNSIDDPDRKQILKDVLDQAIPPPAPR